MFNYDHLDAETISAVLENCRCLLCPCLGRPSLAIAIILLTDHFLPLRQRSGTCYRTTARPSISCRARRTCTKLLVWQGLASGIYRSNHTKSSQPVCEARRRFFGLDRDKHASHNAPERDAVGRSRRSLQTFSRCLRDVEGSCWQQ